MKPRDPYTEKAVEPGAHFTMTDAERPGERLTEAVHAFRDAYRALDRGCRRRMMTGTMTC
jgi:hypothetical protein